MITISTPTFDLAGSVTLNETASTDTASMGRRVSRIATLDGSAEIADYGYSDSDRTLKIVAKVDAVTLAKVQRLVQLYPRLISACRDGLFYGEISALKPKKSALTITFLVKEQLQ